MKVKIGDTVHDSENEPLMIVLSEREKSLISGMGEATALCSFPEWMDREAVEAFMKIEQVPCCWPAPQIPKTSNEGGLRDDERNLSI